MAHLICIQDLKDEHQSAHDSARRCLLMSVSDPFVINPCSVETEEIVVLSEKDSPFARRECQMRFIGNALHPRFVGRQNVHSTAPQCGNDRGLDMLVRVELNPSWHGVFQRPSRASFAAAPL